MNVVLLKSLLRGGGGNKKDKLMDTGNFVICLKIFGFYWWDIINSQMQLWLIKNSYYQMLLKSQSV